MLYIIRIVVLIFAALDIKWCIKCYKEESYFFCGIFAVLAIYLIYGLCVPLNFAEFIGG